MACLNFAYNFGLKQRRLSSCVLFHQYVPPQPWGTSLCLSPRDLGILFNCPEEGVARKSAGGLHAARWSVTSCWKLLNKSQELSYGCVCGCDFQHRLRWTRRGEGRMAWGPRGTSAARQGRLPLFCLRSGCTTRLFTVLGTNSRPWSWLFYFAQLKSESSKSSSAY